MAKVKDVFYHLKTGKKYYPNDEFKGSNEEINRLVGLGKLHKPQTKTKKKSE